jgi:MFS family permease
MTTTIPKAVTGKSRLQALWAGIRHRSLDGYPPTSVRYLQLGQVFVLQLVLYYQLFVTGSVAPQVLADLHMSFLYFIMVMAFSSLAGAFASLVAGLGDRWGRANIAVYGTLITSLLAWVVIPSARSGATFAVCYGAVSVVEGAVLVATPTLVRDFSPQISRGTAMSIWSLGPVLASLALSVVVPNTLPKVHPDWQGQFQIAGCAGFVIFVAVWLGLRELSPQLRNQVLADFSEIELLEARAQHLSPNALRARRWRQMLQPTIIIPTIALFLMIYYFLIGLSVVYFETALNFSPQQANALGQWAWAANAVVGIGAGVLSDRFKVRKPFILAGATILACSTLAFILTVRGAGSGAASQPAFATMALLLVGVAGGVAATFVPWVAGITESVEERNPALTATGLSLWGLALRAVTFLTFILAPVVVHSMTTVVDQGPQVAAMAAQYSKELALVQQHPSLFAQLQSAGPTPALLAEARQQLGPAFAADLTAVQKAGPALRYLGTYGPEVSAAVQQSRGQWVRYFWICLIGVLLFIPLMSCMPGAWRPSTARRAALEHAKRADEELRSLRGAD